MTEDPAPTPPDRLVRRTTAVLATRVVLLVLGVVASVVVARALGPSGRGQYALVVALAGTTVALSHLSVEQAQVYLSSTGTPLRSLAANGALLAAVVGGSAVAVVLLLVLVTGYPTAQPLGDLPLIIALAAVPLSLAVLYSNGLLVVEGRTDLLNYGALLGGGLQCTALGVLALTGRLSVVAVVAVWTASAALPLLISLAHLRPRRRDLSLPLVRSELRLGLRYHTGLASLFLLLKVDVLILAALRPDADVGLYALAVSLVELTNVATDALATVVVKRQVALALDEAAVLTARVVGITTVLAVVVVAALVATAGLLVPLVYGTEFSGAVPALYALAPGVLALAATRSAGGYLVRLNRPWTIAAFTTTALLVNVVLNLVLIPGLGIVGAGLATSVAYGLLAACYLSWLRRAAGLPVRAFVPRRLSA